MSSTMYVTILHYYQYASCLFLLCCHMRETKTRRKPVLACLETYLFSHSILRNVALGRLSVSFPVKIAINSSLTDL